MRLLLFCVHRIGDAVLVKAEDVKSALEFAFEDLFNHIVNGVIDPFDHRGQDKTRLDPVLVGVDADDEFVGFARSGFLPYCSTASNAPRPEFPAAVNITSAPFRSARKRKFLAFPRVVPGSVGHADVVAKRL